MTGQNNKDLRVDDNFLFGLISSSLYKPYPMSFRDLIELTHEYVHDKIGLTVSADIRKHLKYLLSHELVLYLTDKRYRDHLLHCLRVAILGEEILCGKIYYDGENKSLSILSLVVFYPLSQN